MEQNNFEKQVKEQLERRELRPSEEAWNRISRQLEVSKTPKTKNLHWYGIAAGFIGIFFASALYFTTRGPSADPMTRVSSSKIDSTSFNKTPRIIPERNIEEDSFIVDNQVQEKKSTQKTSEENSNMPLKAALVSTKDEERKVENLDIPLNTSEELIDAKIVEIVAQVALLEKGNSRVTDAEIDSLLRGAQTQILKDKIFRNDNSVDAMALLADVEDELDQSFRDQIFDALKDGFLKVRTAVADRNN